MDQHENKDTQLPEHESSNPRWSTFAIPRQTADDMPIIEKISSIRYDEDTSITGASLRRGAEIQTTGVYPSVSDVETVDAIIIDPQAAGQLYAYIRLRPGSADCYHIVINGDEATSNVAQNIPLEKLGLGIPAGGTIAIAIRSSPRLHESIKPVGIADDELVKLFDTCRSATDDVKPEVLGRKKRKKGFGTAVMRTLTRGQ